MSSNSHLLDSLRAFYNRETGALNVLGLLHNSVAYATPKLLSFLKMPGIDSHLPVCQPPKTYKDEPMVLLTVTGISILDLL